ncbi:unnamed protein product [Allacma fusca]|uniref:CHK kinase-like domain-containing protein n=1 Tax=Allacma fusca TaxID=39272 RepID=A0A8J2K8L9_9HEXA|nr:unnamed protein product [Allacma fusca]
MLPENMYLNFLNKEGLTELIGEPIGEYLVSTGSKPGDNLAGNILAVNIRTQKDEIRQIVIKTPPYDNPIPYRYVKNWRLFDVENRFYGFLVPELKALYKSRGGSEAELNLSVPRYFGGNSDYLALEDVRPLGFKMADKYKGLSFPEVRLFMQCLGKLHASTYCYIKEHGEKIFAQEENIVFNSYPILNHHMPEIDTMTANAYSSIYINGIELLSRKHKILGEKLKKYAPVPHERMMAVYNQTDKKYFPVISHGDVWVNNLIFKYETVIMNGLPVEEAQECMILDFQHSRRENIFWDLLYFMYTSTTPEFRKEFLVPSLNVYYETFVEVAGQFKTPVPIGFTKGWLVKEFLRNVPNIFAYMPFAISLQLGDFTAFGLQSPGTVNGDVLERENPWESYYADFVNVCRTLLEHSPLAMAWLEAIALELDEMGAFDSELLY